MPVFDSATLAGTVLLAALPAAYLLHRALSRGRRHRQLAVNPAQERVLVLGASSGVGRAVAMRYAARGARVCVVARRSDRIAALVKDMGRSGTCIGEVADCGVVEDMVRVRDTLAAEWAGLDTIHICAGVSALQPVMALTGIEAADEDAASSNIQKAVDIAGRATHGNFVGPLTAALTFIPMLTRTSAAPSLLLVSSLAGVIPAPTRALYCATKAASLLLYQALAIEHPRVAFTCVLPATIEGDFRASAVDGGPVRESDPNKHGLKIGYVAARCVDAVDGQVRGNVVLPWFPYVLGHHLYWLWPALVERWAAKKYNYQP